MEPVHSNFRERKDIVSSSKHNLKESNHLNFASVEAKIDNFSTWIVGFDPDQLKNDLEKVIRDSGFTILNCMEHHYEPFGYTALWLLAESHCALHTFPEENRTYIELSSCNRQMYADFLLIFNKSFEVIK